MKTIWVFFVSMTLLLLGHFPPSLVSHSRAAQNDVTSLSDIIQYNPSVKVRDLAGIPDKALVEFAPGKRISLGTLRKLEAKQQNMRAPKIDRLPSALRMKPAATGRRLFSGSELPTILKLPDQETIILPSGRRVTVGQIKFLWPFVEKQTGVSLTMMPKRSHLQGAATKVDDQSDWQTVLKMPDSSVLESPRGQRITVAEARQYLAQHPEALATAPAGSRLIVTPQNKQRGGTK